MMNSRRSFLLATLFSLVLSAVAQTPAERMRQYVGNIQAFNRLFPQEKVYLHLDNTGYFRGETLWYKAYVVRTDKGVLSDLSRVLYVELVDPFGEIVETQKLKIEGGQCHGDFSLEQVRASGFYEVRAYTRYNVNWPSAGIFSRVVPIFERPERAGDYSQPHIRQDLVNYRVGSDLPDSLQQRSSRRAAWSGEPVVTFYPEGGQLVQGLMNHVAFAVSLPDSDGLDFSGELCTADGEVLAEVQTLREGRGSFLCVPTGEALFLCFTHGGKLRRYQLPDALAEGCVLSVNALGAKHVTAEVTATSSLCEETLGLTLMHNGNVLAFDTLQPTADGWDVSYDRTELPAGVHQLTLFTPGGRILAQRHFFVAPQQDTPALLTARASFPDTTLVPHKHVRMALEGPSNTVLSVAVRDAAATTNGSADNAATYLLLASDLKGFVRRADYYLEADDAEHRRAADLLCLVQGWTRYDWAQMSGNAPFVKKQPIEDRLYIDGKVCPRRLYADGLFASKKAKARARDVSNIRLSLSLSGEQYGRGRGTAVTDSTGHYAFAVPDSCVGRNDLLLYTEKEGKAQNYIISVNRLFSPERKVYALGEQQLFAPADTVFRFNCPAGPYAEAATANAFLGERVADPYQLSEAVVTAKRDWRKATRRHYEVTRAVAEERSQFHYNMDLELDKYLDADREVPFLSEWLLDKPIFRDAFFTKGRGIGWLQGDSTMAQYSLHPPQSMHYTWEALPDGSVSHDSFDVNYAIDYQEPTDEGERNSGAPLLAIDEVSEVFVTLDNDFIRYMSRHEQEKLRAYDPFHVFVYPHYQFPDNKRRGERRTYFDGWNVPHTFQQPDYARLPAEPDFRRTLYWNPDLRLDAAGRASVEFWNNSTARAFTVSAEGVTASGQPVVAR